MIEIAKEKLEIVLSALVQNEAGRRRSVFAFSPASPVNKIGSDIFKYTPPVFRIRILDDIAYNTVVKIKSGENPNPTIETLQKIAKVLNISIENLLK